VTVDPTDDAPLKPVSPPEHLESFDQTTKGDFYSRCVLVLSAALAVIAIIGSAIGFAGFAENDQNITHLMSAFLLSFGLGSLAFLPLLIIAFYAKNAIWTPLPRYRVFVVLLLILPWFCLCFYLFKLGGLLRMGAIISGLSGLFMALWALRFLKAR